MSLDGWFFLLFWLTKKPILFKLFRVIFSCDWYFFYWNALNIWRYSQQAWGKWNSLAIYVYLVIFLLVSLTLKINASGKNEGGRSPLHIQTCLDCVELLLLLQPAMFSYYVYRNLSQKSVQLQFSQEALNFGNELHSQ